MKLTKQQLKQIIKEELVRTLLEGDVIQGPWGPNWRHQAIKAAKGLGGSEGQNQDPLVGDELSPDHQYEYILDELVDAARDSILPLAIEKLKAAGALGGEGPAPWQGPGISYHDLELEIEEPLLDALKPLAKLIQAKVTESGPEKEY